MHNFRKSPTPIPARVLLSGLEPIGVGTDQCESLPGYVGRLAAVHGVTPVDMTDYVRSLPPIEGERYAMEVGYKPYWGATPGLFATRLARLTGVPSVGVLGMPWADHTISLRKHVRKSPVWCSECWRDDLEAGRPRYDRLLWNFEMYGHCHRHGRKLEGLCPGCRSAKLGSQAGVVLAGLCNHCGADLLGRQGDGVAEQEVVVSPSEREVQFATLLVDLVTEMPALGELARWPDLERAVEAIKVRAGLEFQMDALREAKASASHIYQMRQPERMRRPIGLGPVIKIAAAAGMRIPEILKMGTRKGSF